MLENKVLDFASNILICGGCSYPIEWDYAKFRQTADRCEAILVCDMAHISGLAVAKVLYFSLTFYFFSKLPRFWQFVD